MREPRDTEINNPYSYSLYQALVSCCIIYIYVSTYMSEMLSATMIAGAKSFGVVAIAHVNRTSSADNHAISCCCFPPVAARDTRFFPCVSTLCEGDANYCRNLPNCVDATDKIVGHISVALNFSRSLICFTVIPINTVISVIPPLKILSQPQQYPEEHGW